MTRQRFHRAGSATAFAVFLAAALGACSGGGSSPAPQTTGTPVNGEGPAIVLDQRVNFTVVVPPPVPVATAAKQRRRFRPAGTGNPYVSPNTGSVSLQLQTVDGTGPRTLSAPVVVNVSCGGAAGCSVPIQNVAAARGIDRFSVITFAGPNATGATISSAAIDVRVPSAQATSFGGTALSIGGYVSAISLALTIPNGTFVWHLPGTATLDVNAVDPAGAIIIGADQFAAPITVALPGTDANAFTIGAAQQLDIQQPTKSITLAYDGSVISGATINATTTDENSAPVATSIPIPVRPPPTPTPKPVPSTKPPLSLYVYDGTSDRILEYGGVNATEGGAAFSATPRRVFDVAPDPSANLVSYNLTNGPSVASIAVDSSGTIYAQTYFEDAATQSKAYSFTYSASTHETVPAQGLPTPPPPTSTFSVALQPSSPFGIRLDEKNRVVYVEYQAPIPATGVAPYNVIGLPLDNPNASATTNIGLLCFNVIGTPAGSCQSNPDTSYGPFTLVNNFAVDGNGFLYVPSAYLVSDPTTSNPITPPGPANEAFPGEPAVLTFRAGSIDPAPTPLSALAGFTDELGAASGTPLIAIEGSTLYTLTNSVAPVSAPPALTSTVYPGLAGCSNPPSANAPVDTAAINCADGNTHVYLGGYSNATSTLTSAGAAGTNVISPPTFLIGGDVIGGFGLGLANSADPLAVRDGFAYVITLSPDQSHAEIDVYNTNGVTGYHTDIAPVARLALDPSVTPTAIAIGPTGTNTSGLDILRRPARVHHDLRAWARQLQARRARLLGHGNVKPR